MREFRRSMVRPSGDPRYKTPLRYPGGKQRLAGFFRKLIETNALLDGEYAEPYAGGAGVAIELLLDATVNHVHLNDSSLPIYAFWHSVKTNPEQLCARISRARLNIDEWRRRRDVVQKADASDLLHLGFSTFYLNRCNRSGLLNAGVIGGQAQEGESLIDARFPKRELIRRIETIADNAKQMSVTNLDAEDFMLSYLPERMGERGIVYCDPPYYERAERLYLNSYQREDHARLSRVIQEKLLRNWVVSYDRHPDIVRMYSGRTQFTYDLQYSATRVYKGREVFILSDTLLLPPLRTMGLALNASWQVCLSSRFPPTKLVASTWQLANAGSAFRHSAGTIPEEEALTNGHSASVPA
jgi:DNA adenine methylase